MENKIKNKRLESGLKQKFVAEYLGMSSRNYQRIENEEIKKVKDEVLKNLSSLFKCSIKDLK
ncbi:helix-turn-helix transcriptional regulator [Clostridium sp.]|uniref:helix-turn-helix domain-containing protein n=1 Tax=Clostridium sp. TaxID=1506 RepID=UPI003217042A